MTSTKHSFVAMRYSGSVVEFQIALRRQFDKLWVHYFDIGLKSTLDISVVCILRFTSNLRMIN